MCNLLSQPPGNLQPPDDGTRAARLQAGSEPLPGYRLHSRLGQGRFGEVWKCDAPGGLTKALKFIVPAQLGAGPAALEQTRQALEWVKTLEHPSLLAPRRIEVVDGVLVLVLDLAERSLHDLWRMYRQFGQPGLPRDELLGYLLKVAETLDGMSGEHGLLHLDLKPTNLLLASGQIRVADFGLVPLVRSGFQVAPPGEGTPPDWALPLYTAPELLDGNPGPASDQYSLAILYQQLLTGTLPFVHDDPAQLVLMHRLANPDLAIVATGERPALLRALSKAPEKRFRSCVEFLQTLTTRPSRSGLSGVRPVVRSGMFPAVRTQTIPQSTQETVVQVARTSPWPGPSGEQAAPCQPPSGKDSTGLAVPGYRCLGGPELGSLGPVWSLGDACGRRRRALCLPGAAAVDSPLVDRLKTLRHPALPATDVYQDPGGGYLLLADHRGVSLRDLFEAGLQAGSRGLAREQLLGYLRQAAEALDDLWQRYRLPHLGLNPRKLLLDDQRILLEDFGLVSLLWLPTGEPAGPLNSRHAAPELFRPEPPGPAADQYSLALIYAELVTGFLPRPRRTSRGASGTYPVVRGGLPPAAGLDLDLLPALDRAAITRALDPDPARRFPSCRAFLDALPRTISVPAGPGGVGQELPSIVPLGRLLDTPFPPGPIPPLSKLLAELGHGASRVRRRPGHRYTVHSDGSWEYHFPVRLFPGALRLRVEGLRQHWKASGARAGEESFLLTIRLPGGRRSWLFQPKDQPKLEVEFKAMSPAAGRKLSEVRVLLRPVNASAPAVAESLAELRPQLETSLRCYLQAETDQRKHGRWPCPHPLHVYPVAGGRVGERLAGMGKDLSAGGASFILPRALEAPHVYLHWQHKESLAPFAVLARVVRVQPIGDNQYEVGTHFPGAEADR